MSEKLSALTVLMAIAFDTTREPQQFFPETVWRSAPAKEVRAWMFVHDLIDRQDEFGIGTDKLHAWVVAICSIPLPVCEWRIPEPRP